MSRSAKVVPPRISAAHCALLDQELAEYESNPGDVLTHEEVFAELRSLLNQAGKIELVPGYDHKARRGCGGEATSADSPAKFSSATGTPSG